MCRALPVTVLALFGFPILLRAEPPRPTLTPLVRTIDLRVGEAQEVELAGGKKVAVKLLGLHEDRDDLRHAGARRRSPLRSPARR
jgi:hypothetical protein